MREPRPSRGHGRPLAESAHRLDVADLWRAGWMVPGQTAGGRLAQDGSVDARVDLSGQVLPQVRLTDFRTGYERAQVIRLTSTRSAIGTARWWLVCPATGRRVRVLYRLPGQEQFAGRRSLGITYLSQRQTDAARAMARATSARRCLCAAPSGSGSASPVRPRGMHASTYARLLAVVAQAP